jgi:hypothetical protein
VGFLLIHGTRVHTVHERTRRARCGRCLAKTEQNVCSLEARRHVYFIEYGRAQSVGRVAECTVCKGVVPVRRKADVEEGRTDEERWIDAFLDAHVLELERAYNGPLVSLVAVGVALLVIGALALLVWLVAALEIAEGMRWAILLGGLGVGLVLAFSALRPIGVVIGDRVFARGVKARLGRLRESFQIGPADLAARARERGLDRLARHFEGARYAVVGSGAGPYRSA